jgi:hypothetical protein
MHLFVSQLSTETNKTLQMDMDEREIWHYSIGDKGHTVQWKHKSTRTELENVSPRAATSGPESPAVARDGAVVIQSVRSERVRHLHFLAV